MKNLFRKKESGTSFAERTSEKKNLLTGAGFSVKTVRTVGFSSSASEEPEKKRIITTKKFITLGDILKTAVRAAAVAAAVVVALKVLSEIRKTARGIAKRFRG